MCDCPAVLGLGLGEYCACPHSLPSKWGSFPSTHTLLAQVLVLAEMEAMPGLPCTEGKTETTVGRGPCAQPWSVPPPASPPLGPKHELPRVPGGPAPCFLFPAQADLGLRPHMGPRVDGTMPSPAPVLAWHSPFLWDILQVLKRHRSPLPLRPTGWW